MSKQGELTVTHIQKKIHTIQLKNTPYASLQHLVPNTSHASVSFEVRNASTEFVNAIRRCITNELEIKYLTVDMANIDVPNGTNIVKEVVLQRIESIPIDQSISSQDTFKLYKNNDEFNTIDVTSGMIVPAKSNTKKSQSSSLFTGNITICTLDVNQYICVDNIYVHSMRGKDNGRAALGVVGFEVIDQDMNQSSLTVHPTSFRFTIETNGNFNKSLMAPIHMCVANLTSRLDIIDQALSEKEYSHGIHFSTEFGVFKLFIPNETHTIGNLMKRYIFLMDPSIEYVNYRIIHPSKEEIVIDIKNHSNPKKICRDAITYIKKDLQKFGSFFKKHE